jgi:two-component system, sensor histidine kinase PdtaS
MSSSFRNDTVRGRLLRLVAIVLVPLVLGSSCLAYVNYSNVRQYEELNRSRLAEEFALRVRLFYRGMLRGAETLFAVRRSEEMIGPVQAFCAVDGEALLRTSPTIVGVVLHGRAGDACVASSAAAPIQGAMLQSSLRELSATSLSTWGLPTIFDFRYGAIQESGQILGIVQARARDQPSNGIQAVSFFFSATSVDSVIDFGSMPHGAIVGFVAINSDMLLNVRGEQDGAKGWLPQAGTASAGGFVGTSRDGRKFSYVSRDVIPPDMRLIAAFPAGQDTVAQLQYAILAVGPLLILVAFAAAFWRLVDRDIGKSIDVIEGAARKATQGDFHGRAAVDDHAPLELRRVSEAVNQIIQSASRREDELGFALSRNQVLMRELHHRVKNSLQVIQSYLAITRRRSPDSDSHALREAEAKVMVLSIAYRYALTDGGLRAVDVRLFIADLFAQVRQQVRSGGGAGYRLDLKTTAQLEVDRVIALGLALAEVVFSVSSAASKPTLTLSMNDHPPEAFTVVLSCTDRGEGAPTVATDTLRGLRMQLGAMEDPLGPDEVLRWTIAVGR